MKRISLSLFVMFFALSANADWSWNDAYGTYEDISDNYTKPTCGEYIKIDEDMREYNESNGYWDYDNESYIKVSVFDKLY